jgi:CheY-like chemotaxis protein
VAHDFNNLLMVVLGQSEGLLAQLAEDDPLRRGLESIRTSADRATRLTQQLLAFSRRQPMRPRLLDLNAIVTGMETLLRPLIGEQIRLVTKTDPLLWLVEADSSHVEQILMNLAVNARDAMPGGGTLAIGTRNIDLDRAAAAVLPPMSAGQYVLLTVGDTGQGMTAEVRAHLFEPFFTTKARSKGTGLGLSTVYGTVKQSQGFIFVDSEVGAGSTFRIYLPRREGSLDADAAAPSERAERGAETVLLAEDEGEVRALLREMLERQGYTVIETANGRHALQAAASYAGGIDLLVTDVVMPEMGGHELAERLAVARPGTPVLFLSGYDDDAIRNHRGPDAGSALLQKPFTAATLSARIRGLLESRLPHP